MKRTSPLRRSKPIRKVSTKRAKQLREYNARRVCFLREHPVCQVWLRENGWDQADDGWFYSKKKSPTQINSVLLMHLHHAPAATEVHHRNGRTNDRLNDERFWLAVCRESHEWIHNHAREARAKGYLI